MSSKRALLRHSALRATMLFLAGSALFHSPAATATLPRYEVFLTRDEALELAFPRCEVERTPIYLKPDEKKKIAKLAGVKFESSVLYAYCATRKGKVVGTAYFDTHRVRSLRETLMVVIAPDQTVQRIEVLSFGEPQDYIPRQPFYDQYKKRKLNVDLQLNRKIRNVTGATLTARATTDCARRVLAQHQVIQAREKSAPKAKPAVSTDATSSSARRTPGRDKHGPRQR